MAGRVIGLVVITALFVTGISVLRGVVISQEASEYQVKAAFLYNFAKFIDWPTEAFKDDLAPVNLCILGTDPFGDTLNTIKDKTVKGRKLTLKRLYKLEDPGGCHILFISASEKGNVKQIIQSLKNSPVLTISEGERFAHGGGMINFIIA